MRFFLLVLVALSAFGCVDAEVVFAEDATLSSPSTFVMYTAEPTLPATATAEPTATPTGSPTPIPTATSSPTPTDTPTSTPIPSPTPTPTATALPDAITWAAGVGTARVIPAVSVQWSPYEDRLLYKICGTTDGNTVEGNREGKLWVYDARSAELEKVKFRSADGAICDDLGVEPTWGHERNAVLFSAAPALGASDVRLTFLDYRSDIQVGAALRYPRVLQRDAQTIWYESDLNNGAKQVVAYSTARRTRSVIFGMAGEFGGANGAFAAIDLHAANGSTTTAIVPVQQLQSELPNTTPVTRVHPLTREKGVAVYRPNILTDNTAFVGWVANSHHMLLLAWDDSAEKTLLRWNVATGEIVALAVDVERVVASGSADYVALVSDDGLTILDTQSGESLHQFSMVGDAFYWLTDSTVAHLDSAEQWRLLDVESGNSAMLTSGGGRLLDNLTGSATGQYVSGLECVEERCRVVVVRNPLR